MSQLCYGFPILDVGEIVSMFGMDSLLTEKDFKTPLKERWQKFFTVIVCENIGATPETINNPLFETEFSQPSLHEDALPLFTLARALQRVLFTCGINDFKISDIIAPKEKRLIKICSALGNFTKFQEERLEVYNRIKHENQSLQDQRNILIAEKDEYMSEINDIRASKAATEPLVKQIQDEIEARRTAMRVLHESVCQSQKAVSAVKSSFTERKNANARLNEQLAVAKEEDLKLSSQIVPSPQRMKAERLNLQRRLQHLKAQIPESVQKLVEIRQQREFQALRDAENEQSVALITSLSQQHEKQKQLQSTRPTLRDKTQSQRDLLRDQQSRQQVRDRLLASKRDKIEKVTNQHKLKVAGMMESLDCLSNEGETLKQLDDGKQAAVEELHMRRQDIAEIQRQHDLAMGRARTRKARLLKAVDCYHDNLSQSWESLKKSSGYRGMRL